MKRFLFLSFFFGLLLAGAQPMLVTQEVSDEISMKVPSELKREPITLQRTTSTLIANYMSADRRTDLSINQSTLRWSQADEELLAQFYKANILNIYDQVDMIQEEIKEINGRKFIVFEFSAQVVDEPNAFKAAQTRSDYTYIQYSIVQGGVMIFRFTAPNRMKNYWSRMINESMNSVEFKTGKRK